jgi:hypothetical protein
MLQIGTAVDIYNGIAGEGHSHSIYCSIGQPASFCVREAYAGETQIRRKKCSSAILISENGV